MAENELKNAAEHRSPSPATTETGGEVMAQNDLKNDVPSHVQKPVAQQSIMSEFFIFLKEEKKWWLGPLVVVLLALSAVIIFAEGSAIAPFIYSIF